MSRFFKSAAFPILIVIVLAILATKVIGGGGGGPHYTFGNMLYQLDHKQVQKLTLNQKSNSAEVQLKNGQKYTVGYPNGYAQTLLNTAKEDLPQTPQGPSGLNVDTNSSSIWQIGRAHV